MVVIMEKRKTKTEIVRMLLRDNELASEDEEELLDLLIDQPISIDVDKQEEAKMTRGDRIADKVSEIAGSWGFILLNLLLSCLAALQAPVIMMSQNRQAAKDSLRNQNDYRTDLKSELILESLHDKIELILKNQKKILKYFEQDSNEKE